MKQTIISRILTAAGRRSILVAILCMVISLGSALTVTAADQRRGGERTEQRRNNEGNREQNRRNDRGQRGNDGRRNAAARNRQEQRKRDDNAAIRPVNRPQHQQGAGVRPGHNGNGSATRPGNSNPSTRPGGSLNNNGYRPGAAGNNRPSGGNNNFKPGHDNGFKPGHDNNNHKPGHDNGFKPGHGNNNHKPGHDNGFKPGHGNNRPGGNHGPGHNWNPGRPNHVRPGAPIHRPPVAPPPMRPMRPAHFFGYHRPLPPPAWRPGPRPLFSTVLGLTFGSAISVGIDALISSGYTVDGYYDNNVYVNDVVQLNMRWPFGVLQYNNAGRLVGSEFVYSSDWRDLNRYNMAFGRLSSLYGPPVQSYSDGGNLSSTWWGPGGQYVTLRFDYRAPMQGGYRFYTTLSFGM